MLRSVLPGIFQIDLPWTNCWLLSDGDEGALIDTGTRWDRAQVLDAIGNVRIRKVVLTHGHCDHAGNAAWLCDEFAADLIAHENEAPYVERRRRYGPRGIRSLGPQAICFAVGELAFPVARRRLERAVVQDDTIETPIGPLTVIATPGHTPGHTSYYHEESGWLFSGDALLTVIPFKFKGGLSLPPPIFNHNTPQAIRSLNKLAELRPTCLFAGHGRPVLEDTADSIARYFESVQPEVGSAK